MNQIAKNKATSKNRKSNINDNSIKDLTLIEQAEYYLKQLNDYRYNEVTGNIEFKCKECSEGDILGDYDVNSLNRMLAKKKINIGIGTLRNLLKSDFIEKYDPFDRYFNNLPGWDGSTDYIQLLAETVKTNNDQLWQTTFKKWIVALVASLMDNDSINHTMIVLSGVQGVGKTTWILKLVPPELHEYCYSGIINPDNKDTMIHLAECMLINLDELENLNNTKLGSIKELITKTSIRLRRPYGSVSETLPRRASFAGSVNNKEFLNDTTGSRRFLCFDVLDINRDHKIPIQMVYAQALSLFRNGYVFWFDKEEIAVINNNNEQYRVQSIEEELLMTYFETCSEVEATHLISTSEILSYINEKVQIPLNNATKQRLGKALRANNFTPLKKKGRQVYALKEKSVVFATYGFK